MGMLARGPIVHLPDGRLSVVPSDHDRVGGRPNEDVHVVLHERGQESVNLIGVRAALTPLGLAFPSTKHDTDAGAPGMDLNQAKVDIRELPVNISFVPAEENRPCGHVKATLEGVAVSVPNFQCRITGYTFGTEAATDAGDEPVIAWDSPPSHR
jgi:hypothetical protein